MSSKDKTIIEDGEEKEEVKCVMIGRLPRREGDPFKTAVFRLFEENNGHLKGGFPVATLEYPNIEKVRVRRLNTTYYLEGNDIIVNDLTELRIIRKGNILFVRGYQGANEDLPL